jgi:hypothetical protein
MRHLSGPPKRLVSTGILLACLAAGAAAAEAQRQRHGGPPAGRGGPPAAHAEGQQADMRLLHELFDHRAEIVRQVTRLPNGVETLTESTNPAVVRTLQAHVASMLARVEEARPIHQRDPLFREIFRHAAFIDARHETTANGVRVIETSTDPYVAKLIQAHADVVTAFIANGRVEMMRNHEVPAR